MVALPDWPKFKGNSDIDLRLSRVTKFLSLIGNPHNKLNNVIHVAGTNGKGSTISFLRSFLESSGKTVNIYTSPHLIEF
ncbi:MAG: bifunctional folylpolyglutamate synthase/dihydrofolate synthase, partial [Flavobacteriaceae bacterium]